MRFSVFVMAALLLCVPAVIPSSAADATTPPAEEMLPEISVGAADAPVTIVEFSSLNCKECAAFHANVLPAVNEQLIKTGQARYVLHDMPMDRWSMKASLLARCLPASQYATFAHHLQSTRDEWMRSPHIEKTLIELVAGYGLDEKAAKACLYNSGMQKKLNNEMKAAKEAYNITTLPAFAFKSGSVSLPAYPPFDKIMAENTK